MKLLFFDLETTGVDHKRHGIHQLSGKITHGSHLMEVFNFKVRPHDEAEIDPAALAIAGITPADLNTYEPMEVVFAKFKAMLNKHVSQFNPKDKFHLVGYNNASFDNQFLRMWFSVNGDKWFGSYFWSDSIDVLCMASHHLRSVRYSMPNFQLKTVAQHMGIQVDPAKLHDALYDIELTEEIYNRICSSQPVAL